MSITEQKIRAEFNESQKFDPIIRPDSELVPSTEKARKLAEYSTAELRRLKSEKFVNVAALKYEERLHKDLESEICLETDLLKLKLQEAEYLVQNAKKDDFKKSEDQRPSEDKPRAIKQQERTVAETEGMQSSAPTVTQLQLKKQEKQKEALPETSKKQEDSKDDSEKEKLLSEIFELDKKESQLLSSIQEKVREHSEQQKHLKHRLLATQKEFLQLKREEPDTILDRAPSDTHIKAEQANTLDPEIRAYKISVEEIRRAKAERELKYQEEMRVLTEQLAAARAAIHAPSPAVPAAPAKRSRNTILNYGRPC